MAWVVGETSVGPPSGVDPMGTMRLQISNNNNNNFMHAMMETCNLGIPFPAAEHAMGKYPYVHIRQRQVQRLQMLSEFGLGGKGCQIFI